MLCGRGARLLQPHLGFSRSVGLETEAPHTLVHLVHKVDEPQRNARTRPSSGRPSMLQNAVLYFCSMQNAVLYAPFDVLSINLLSPSRTAAAFSGGVGGVF